jgi:hypothetical protein
MQSLTSGGYCVFSPEREIRWRQLHDRGKVPLLAHQRGESQDELALCWLLGKKQDINDRNVGCRRDPIEPEEWLSLFHSQTEGSIIRL